MYPALFYLIANVVFCVFAGCGMVQLYQRLYTPKAYQNHLLPSNVVIKSLIITLVPSLAVIAVIAHSHTLAIWVVATAWVIRVGILALFAFGLIVHRQNNLY